MEMEFGGPEKADLRGAEIKGAGDVTGEGKKSVQRETRQFT